VRIGTIKNKFVRRFVLLVSLPFVFTWHLNWRLIAFPVFILWNAIIAGLLAFSESVADDCTVPSIKLLVAGVRACWNGVYVESAVSKVGE
jgi:hypothetical protein